MIRFLILSTLLVLIAAQSVTLADQQHDDLNHALARLEEGTALLEQQDQRSAAVLDEAAAMLSDVIEQHHIQSPEIYHALGNAYMLNNNLGHAVLAYRNGEQLDPTNSKLSDSLSYARSLVNIHVEPDASNRVWTALLVWRGYIPRNGLWIVFASMFTIGWLSWSAQILGFMSKKIRVVGVWLIAVSMVPAGMLGSEWARYHGSSAVVITGSNVIARSGPNDTIYDPVYADGLLPGTEAIVLETRDGWNHLELADGSHCWVPVASLELVNP